jgi:hypothetical protein
MMASHHELDTCTIEAKRFGWSPGRRWDKTEDHQARIDCGTMMRADCEFCSISERRAGIAGVGLDRPQPAREHSPVGSWERA